MVLIQPKAVLEFLDQANQKRKAEDQEKVTFASAVAFMTDADAADLIALQSSMYSGRLAKGQILWTPAGMICAEKTGASDHMGLKASFMVVAGGAMAQEACRGDVQGIDNLRKMKMEAADSNKKSDMLDQVLKMVANKETELKSSAAPHSAEVPKAQDKSPAKDGPGAESGGQGQEGSQPEEPVAASQARPAKQEIMVFVGVWFFAF